MNRLLGFGAVLVLGCSPSPDTVPPGSSSSTPPEAGSVGTPTKDGASGVCCPARTGGCALQGGYHPDGNCAGNEICDDMCEQRIVIDEHGCETLTFKTPRIATTYAGPQSCDDPIFTGIGRLDAGADAGDAGADAH